MLPLIRSRISASLSEAFCVRSSVTWLGQPASISENMPAAEQIWPGVQ